MLFDQEVQDWRKYQQSKRRVKLRNMEESKIFPCLVLIGSSYTEVYLKFIENNMENIIQVVSRERFGVVSLKIQLASLRGYNIENQNIILNLGEEQEDVKHITLQFTTADVLTAAFASIEEFGRERVKNVATPPSSSESE